MMTRAHLLQRLLAVASTAAVASCGSSHDDLPVSAAAAQRAHLSAVPEIDRCTPATDPTGGPCCKVLECYTPPGDATCAPPPEGPADLGPGTAPLCIGGASGACHCGPIEGPFAGPYEGPTPFVESDFAFCADYQELPFHNGTCCYFVPIRGCTGRPLVVEGSPLVARLRARDDWAA